ncbi:family 2 glycoside hydrolase [Kockovaella imperatae]|uniref:Family 2 glycoside hydrolase n=1 Tax=Kockovaella imperatae TaxID=4999 RepID=A0A1Y1UD77_9TREE|nr:family 2 glycoside hydrolase [Kockovaella imperatae]ORX35972.1 family 2 glycoside hydrolase [Kockovaella imperatae]
MLSLLAAVAGLALPQLALGGEYSSASSYKVQTPPLTTDWTYNVGTDPWTEYPRPQLVRDRWQSLNGIWSYKNASASDLHRVPSGDLGQAIMIPSCIESALSGVMTPLDEQGNGNVKYSWFTTTFDVPSDWKEDDVVINFGAADWEATVFVNGKEAGFHRGGWTRFSIDITKHLKKHGQNELAVFVYDPTDSDEIVISVGKQTLRPDHIFYTPCSGIWGSVFIEPVPKAHIAQLDVSGDMHGKLTIKAHSSNGKSAPVHVHVYDPSNNIVASGSGTSDEDFVVRVGNPDLWSPEHPHLYDIKVKFGDDEVKSYTGFRTIEKGEVEGVVRPLLNGEFYLAFGPLDQGYWPDGLLTPPNREAMVYDLQVLKELGFNMVRKHIKVEPDLFYRACDEMGLLVMQDMPSMRPNINKIPSESEQEEFTRQLVKLVETHKSFPSIYTWVIYNEGWGQRPNAPESKLVPIVRELDPTRLINAVTGWHDSGYGDYHDNHHYSMPQCGTPFYSIPSSPYDPKRIGFQGEFGGVSTNTSMEHIWNVPKSFANINMTYEIDETIEVWNERAHEILDALRDQIQRYSCSGGVYTQTTDVEGEMNGLITYDRRLKRYDPAQWQRDIQALYDAAASRGGARIGSSRSPITAAKQWVSSLWYINTHVLRGLGF